MQFRGMPRTLRGSCKTVGSAFDGSNPSPATTQSRWSEAFCAAFLRTWRRKAGPLPLARMLAQFALVSAMQAGNAGMRRRIRGEVPGHEIR